MKRLHWQLDRDGHAVTATLPTDPPVVLRLDAIALDDLMRTIGDVRASLQPGHDKTWPAGSRVVAEPDPVWLVEPAPAALPADDLDSSPHDATDPALADPPPGNAAADPGDSATPPAAPGTFGQLILHVRDPRYGWLHYLLPRATAWELAGSLLAQSGANGPDSAADGKSPF